MEKKSQILFGKILRKTNGTTQGGLLRGVIRANEHNLLTNPENTINMLHNTLN